MSDLVVKEDKLAFILLAHESPARLKDLILSIIGSGSDIFIHHDLNSPHDLPKAIAGWKLENYPGNVYFAPRVHVAWGEWSICEATLNCLRKAQEIGLHNYSNYMLASGSCMPTKPMSMVKKGIQEANKDFIEAVDAARFTWVAGGIQNERWEYRHYFNYRDQRTLFYWSLRLQKKLLKKRKLPNNFHPYIGSQWWCLRRSTIESILNVLDANPRIEHFYKTVCVPDECFFQTLVANLVPHHEIDSNLLTQYKFNSWGVPRVYFHDDLEELIEQPVFFARKIDHGSLELKRYLRLVALMSVEDFNNLVKNEIQSSTGSQSKYKAQIRNNLLKWNSCVPDDTNFVDYLKRVPSLIYVCFESDRERVKDFIGDENIEEFSLAFLEDYKNGRSLNVASRAIGALVESTLHAEGFKDVLLVLSPKQAFILRLLKWNVRSCFLYSDLNKISSHIDEKNSDTVYSVIFDPDFFISTYQIDDHSRNIPSFQLRDVEKQKNPTLHLIICNDRGDGENYIDSLLQDGGTYIGPASNISTQSLIDVCTYYNQHGVVYSYSNPYQMAALLDKKGIRFIVHYHPSCRHVLYTGLFYENYKWGQWEIDGRNCFIPHMHWPSVVPQQFERLFLKD
ncbi:hypothetical protein LMG33818_001648 [Halomonadaceae bacterium LMG 33818]|uniref:beta-1,6-N-acetylglucosaminyltransferase n=1 Tax=Cernens ardua TaxID=3402176 RepID=UPI003EDC9ACC